mgnify:CR=1 FL=1
MKKGIIVVTGAKLTHAKRLFSAGQRVTYLEQDGVTYKMNAAVGVIRQLESDYEVIATGYKKGDGETLSRLGLLPIERFHVVDLLDKQATKAFVAKVAALKAELNLPVHLVHYGGASDTKTKLPNDSLLAHTWDMVAEIIPDLVANNCVTLIHILQAMKQANIFEGQDVSKVVFVSAAAAVRAKQQLGLDTAQKGAGHNLIRTIALDLTPENIFVSEVMPGSTDTGFFDNDYTLAKAVEVTENLGYKNEPESYPLFTAEQIGDAVKYVLDANCNVREVVLLPYGQFPHLGA